jgi:photosystem II stability/assembly factor-like uncharacterized protein
LQGLGAQCLALDGDTVYVGCRGAGLKRSADGGDTFEDVPLREPDVFSVAVSAADGAVYVGTEPSRLFCSRDRGESWEEQAALQDIPSARDVHCLAWHPSAPGRAYEAGGDGAAWSRDGGHTWDKADAGRDRRYAWALAVDPADPDRWFVSAAPGPFAAHGSRPSDSAIYRWEGAGPWQMITGPLDSHVYALAIGQSTLFAGLGDGTLLESTDGGESFRPLDERIGGITALAVI